MTKIFTHTALIAGLALATLGTAAASAQTRGTAAASAQTLGERMSAGRLSEAAFQQLISGTGLSADEARGLTLDEIVAIKWQDD